jgi:tRNA(fMet)-specific endonuclease VapC
MTYLWDTDTCIYHLNGNSKVKQKVRSVGAKSIYTTIVTIAELKFGAFNSTRVEANLKRIEELQQKITVLSDFNEAIATVFAENKSTLKQQGITIGDFDLLIASFALHHNMVVVTNNTSHFQPVPNLRLENWSI